MKVSTEEIERRQVVVDIHVDDDRVEQAMDQAYRRMAGRLNIPGFRKGKAPRPLVERMVGREALLDDAIQLLVPVVYKEAVQSSGIKAAAQPQIELVSATPLQIKATVPLEPKVELGDYAAIRLSLPSTDVTAEEIDETVERLRQAHSQWVPVEREVRIGDRVGLDVKATAGERDLLDSKDAEFVVDPEGAEPAPGFSYQIVGMQADEERSFELKLPEDARNPEVQEEHATFQVKLHWVKERELPEVDDEFARQMGAFETVEELRKEIEADLSRRKEEQSRAELTSETIKAVLDRSTVELPPQLIEEHADELEDQFARRLDRQGISVEQYKRLTQKSDPDFRSELLANAEQDLQRSAVLNAVAEAESLDIAADEVDEEIRRIAEGSSNSRRQVRQALVRPEVRERVSSVLRERKAVLRLLDIVTEGKFSPSPSEQPQGESSEQPTPA